MWILALALAAHAAPTEEVCVAISRDMPSGLAVAAPPPAVADFRVQLADGKQPGPVTIADLVRAIPPDSARRRIQVQAAAAPHPVDPNKALVAVQAAAPPGGVAPLKLTLLIDTSGSMYSVTSRELPPLQDEGPADTYRPVNRLAMAKRALHDLVDRLPARATVAVVSFELNQGVTLLSPTSTDRMDRIHAAIDRAGEEKGLGNILALTAAASVQYFDLCADNRVLLVTDDNAALDPDPLTVQKAVAAWRGAGVELWTMSLGLLGRPAPLVSQITALGGGVHLRADTLTEATDQLSASLRANGAAARDVAVVVQPNSARVASWRRIGSDGAHSGPHSWGIPKTVDSGWRRAELYELTLVPGSTGGPLATLTWSAGSPSPGEWARSDEVAVSLTPLADAPPFLRNRAVAVGFGAKVSGEWRRTWEAVAQWAGSVASEQGPGRELAAWAHLMAGRASAAP